MRIAVIGAGIVGVTTAYELAADGHEVTVHERRGSVAAETSFANAGIVAPGYVTPWAAPGMPAKVLRQLWERHAAVRLSYPLDRDTLRWMWRWWRACRLDNYLANRRRMQTLAFYSQRRMQALTASLELDYEHRRGVLVLLRNDQEVAHAQPGLRLLADLGVRHVTLDAAGCRVIEPDLNPVMPLAAGVHLPDDGVGNCRQFAHLMKDAAQDCGVRFRFGSEVQSIQPGSRVTVHLRGQSPSEMTDSTARVSQFAPTQPLLQPGPGDAHQDTFDAVVVCAALDGARLLRPLGLTLPLAAVHGYSVTAPLRDDQRPGLGHASRGPRAALMDERYKTAISRLGDRVRVAGSAELGGRAGAMHPAALATLYKVLDDWFPGVAHLARAQQWKGSRPMLPDGPPVLGASGVPGVWLNLGHGSSGWALSCGCARILADQVAGRAPELDTTGLGLARLGL